MPYRQVLQKCCLFENMSREEMETLLEHHSQVQTFPGDRILYSRSRQPEQIGIVLAGEVLVYKDSGQNVLLNKIGVGGFFGAAALFSANHKYVSVLKTAGECTILQIGIDDFRAMLEASPKLALNYIKFLSGRIEFLNLKIDAFTATDAAQKLSLYLYNSTSEETKNLTELAKRLNMGRASLYRAVEELEKEGIIEKNGKKITVKNRELLKEKGRVQ